jgi:hypothetical protein
MSVECRRAYINIFNSGDEDIKSLPHREKMRLLEDKLLDIFNKKWKECAEAFDDIAGLHELSGDVKLSIKASCIIKKDGDEIISSTINNEINHEIIDRTTIKQDTDNSLNDTTFNVFQSLYGPTGCLDRSWDPTKTLLDQYNALSEENKYIVNMLCTSTVNNGANALIPLLSDKSSSIHTTDGLFTVGVLGGLDIVDDLLYNVITMCHGDFHLIFNIIVDFNNGEFSRDTLIGFAKKDWLTLNPIYRKYMMKVR